MTNFILVRHSERPSVPMPAGIAAPYPLAIAADLTGVDAALLRHYCALGLLGEQRTEGDPTFDDSALYEVRRIEHFRRHHGVNLRALPLICELCREVERLETQLRFGRSP